MEARKVIRKMRKLLETHNLAKGKFYEYDYDKIVVVGMCIRGAGIKALKELGGVEGGEDWLFEHVYPKINKAVGKDASLNPAVWNDAASTTKETVLNALKKAEDPRRWGHIVCTI